MTLNRVVQTTPSGLLAVSDAEGRPGTSKILRPQLDQCPDLTDIYLQADVHTDTHAVSEMRLLSVDKNAAMWNDCFKEHASREDTCILPHFEVHEKKFGLCWQQSLSCTACHYKSRMYKTVFRSKHGQSWSETVCSKCSHPCRTTRYNDGKHKVATHSAHNKHTSPKSKRDAKDIQPGCHNYFSVHD